MDIYGYVYCAYCTATDKCYIGQTTKEVAQRWYLHVKSSKKASNGNYFHSAIRKHGPEAFEVSTLAVAYSESELHDLERLWIIASRSFDRTVGYNSTFGGERGKYNAETCERISRSLKGRKPSSQTLAASIAAHMGKTPWNKGHCKPRRPRVRPVSGWTMSEEQKRKISESQKGKRYSPARIEQMRITSLSLLKKICDHCGAQCHPGSFGRWHGDNCRQKAA
jgi:group I intron endonuclease